MKAIEKLKEITVLFKSCGIDEAEKEAEMLLRGGLDISAVEVFRDNPELSREQVKTIDGMFDRRMRGEPFQYIVGYEEFMGLKLMVGPGVLIPRPETEFLAEQAIKAVHSLRLTVDSKIKYSSLVPPVKGCARKAPWATSLYGGPNGTLRPLSSLSILDVCTGCGCLALSLAREFPDFQVYGTDISEAAVEYAKKNAAINKIKNAVFLNGSLFQPIKKQFTADLIISNPPYINTDDIKNLQPEIKDWEPLIAIDGGADGLDFYREMIPEAGRFLKDNGLIMLELGAGQAGSVAGIMESSGYTQIEIIRDYAGIERIMRATWKR